jgi:hypothetical protein
MEIQYTYGKGSAPTQVLLNGQPVSTYMAEYLSAKQDTGTLQATFPFYSWNTITFQGKVSIDSLILDGIDTEYFVHHGFTENKSRGNAGQEYVKYYFKTPIWQWFIEWKQNDNSTTRQISKTHQGFIPL